MKGFTLIELLIVIAILAILATTVILILNPAQIMREARDTQRMTDLNSIKSAIGLFLVTYPEVVFVCADGTCGIGGNFKEGPFSTKSTTCGFTTACTVPTAEKIYKVDGTGWVGVDLTLTPGSSPLAVLPRDPINSDTYQYAYKASSTLVFELNARLESDKHREKMKDDGGDKNTCSTYTDTNCYYEIGTAPGLAL